MPEPIEAKIMRHCKVCDAEINTPRRQFCPECATARKLDQTNRARKVKKGPPVILSCACGCGRLFTRLNSSHRYAVGCISSRYGDHKAHLDSRSKYPRDKKTAMNKTIEKSVASRSEKIAERVDAVIVAVYLRSDAYERATIWSLNPTLHAQFQALV